MKERVSRRALLFGTSLVAGVLLFASTSMACTVWIGRMTAESGVAGAVKSESFGANNGTYGMVYCKDSPNTVGRPASDHTMIVKVYRRACTPANGGASSSSDGWWPSGAYTVNYLPNPAYDCMNPRGVPIGEMQVSGASSLTATPDGTQQGVSGPLPVVIPQLGNHGSGLGDTGAGPSDKAALCVALAGSAYSNQVQIYVL